MSHQFELIRPTAEVELLVAAADEFHALARSLDDAGHRAIGLHLHGAASALDRALPQQPAWWSNAFNSQEGRSDLFLRIIGALSPAALVETGTYRGTTTGFMADHFAGPIFTCESDTRWYLTARANLARFPQVNVRNQDSRDFLRAVFAEMETDPIFYYLDAHWQADLPLPAELELILSRGRPAAVMIDDFAVPSDPEYHFDDYGPCKALTVDLLGKVDPRGASLFFPTLLARHETGARRGCAVIGIGGAAAALGGLVELQRHDWPTGEVASDVVGPLPPKPPDLTPLRRLVMARNLEAERDRLRCRAETAEAARAAALGETEVLRQERDALRGERDTLSEERDALRRERDALVQERDALRRERDTLVQERDTLRRERDTLVQERDTLRRERESLQSEADALRASTSWRVTAPLRSVGRLLRQ